MPPRFRALLIDFGALALIIGAFIFVSNVKLGDSTANVGELSTATGSAQGASVGAVLLSIEPAATSIPSQATSSVKAAPKPPVQKMVVLAGQAKKPLAQDQVTRIENPYPFPPESFNTVNDAARAALVNILCAPRSGGALSPISGSGIIIDPRGVILTNAHVAQYVLLSESPEINISCVIRSGAPAVAHWSAEVLYIPPVWVEAHAGEIRDPRPVGTGEHDYALLLISGELGSPPPPPSTPGFPYLPFDTREAIGFQGDQVVVASYPAEFLGGLAAQFNLYPASSITPIGQLLTFATRSVDLISLGGIIEAQSGSSGGAVVNAWGRLVGIIATTSEGDTTAARDLRAITLSYINRDLMAQTQFDLPAILGGDVVAEAQDFNTRVAPNLIGLFIEQIEK